MTLLLAAIGLHEPVIQAAQSDDPQETTLRWVENNSELGKWYEANQDKIEKKRLLWLTVVLQRNILATMLFHCSMGHLVEQVHAGDDAFFKAVAGDRSVLVCPTFVDRLTRAELGNDKEFFRHLCSALKEPKKKYMAAIQDLRYSIVALRSIGFDQFLDEDLERLFVGTRLYPNSASALKNLHKHIHAARKLQPPEMNVSGGCQA